MPWVKGQSGNPDGATRPKWFTDQLRIVAAETYKGKGPKRNKLRRLAEVVFMEALRGEPWAANMIADRIEGKPEVTANVNVGPSELFIELLRRISAGEFDRGKLIDGSASTEGTNRQATDGSLVALSE